MLWNPIILLELDAKCYFISFLTSLTLPSASLHFFDSGSLITRHLKPHDTTWTNASQSQKIRQWKKWILTNGWQFCLCLKRLVNVVGEVCWRFPGDFPTMNNAMAAWVFALVSHQKTTETSSQRQLETTPDCDERPAKQPPSSLRFLPAASKLFMKLR